MSDGRYEREVVRALRANDFAALRAPSSGSATDADLPDVLAMRSWVGGGAVRSDVWAIEVKTTKATTAYTDGSKVKALERFAMQAGAVSLLGAKFKRPNAGVRSAFYLVKPTDCRQTDGGNYGIPESDAADRAFALVWPATETNDAEVEVTP